MVPVAQGPQHSLLEALDATRLAIRHYADACRAIQQLPHPSLAGSLLDLNIKRLSALEADLERRTHPAATGDALYAGLNVVHAGLLSLADASGRLRHIYRQAMPVPPPAVEWFIDEPFAAAPAIVQAEGAGSARSPADEAEA